MAYVIGVDIGTQSTKALLVDAQGRIIARHSQGYRVDTPRSGWAEQWPGVWLDAVFACVAACTAEAALAPTQIKALCISSLYGGSGIPVNAAMEPLHPCLIWMDRRAEAQAAQVKAEQDLEQLRAITGNGVDSYYGFTKMLWLKQQRPDIWKSTRWLLPPNSYINWVLTGELAIDHSSAGNLGGVYDLDGRCWSRSLLEALGLDARLMPERLLYSGEVVGGLLAEPAARLGLAPATLVLAGGVDAAMATFAAGATRPGKHVAMLGTSMCWGHLNARADARHGLVSFPHVYRGDRDLYSFGGALTAGASVSWFRGLFTGQDDYGPGIEAESHAAFEHLATTVSPGSDGLLFLPYLMGERSPIWDARASGAFIGLGLRHGKGQLYRAVLEGVSYALRHNIEAGRQAVHTLDDTLVVVGGASQSDLWMQIIADITGFSVLTIEQEVEAAYGAALLAAYATGLQTAEQVERGWVRLRRRAVPEPARQERYERGFQAYCQCYPALKPIFHQLRDMDDA
ncbi:FGGY-family carbohydrate kinase [Pseudomonas sp. DC3000-4b1]|uniref:FGGY-family carbohydrate kinase n=1 Tax=unclassified Pseudomonas TaxID=196821 RepID=UPI003CEB9A79